jgi:RNA polymerase sigma factor (sigma-70 family)
MDAVPSSPDFMADHRKTRITRIVRETGRRLLRFIQARVPSDADAEDILQEVWQQLVTTLDSGPVEQVGAWLYTVARRRIIDGYRKPKPVSLDAMAVEADDPDADAAFDFSEFLLRDDHTPATEHARHLFWDQLHAALAELPQEQRQVFVWHELEALSFQEIAAITGENLNTLLSRKRYAVLHLRRRLESLRDLSFPSNLTPFSS